MDLARVALASAYTELRNVLPDEPWLNVDETGHEDQGQEALDLVLPGHGAEQVEARGLVPAELVLGRKARPRSLEGDLIAVGQAIETPAHVGDAGGKVVPHRGREAQHDASTAREQTAELTLVEALRDTYTRAAGAGEFPEAPA